ncbi:MAG: HAD family phosphatase [Coriobacteriales bacterium]|nr:HAD family phosphatase [Coriobacteriales bacterium]
MIIKAAIFDLDGLLVNTEVVSLRIYQDMLAPYGYDITREEYAQSYSGRTERHNVESIIECYDLPITVDEGLRQVAVLEHGYLEMGVELMPGARELLTWLSAKGIKIALASASVPERAVSLLAQNGVDGHFGHFAYSAECERGKPAPDVFLLAAQRCGADPAECVAFEDSEAGVIADSLDVSPARKDSTQPAL